jgi:hypothetical protein
MPPGEVDEWLGVHFEHGGENERSVTIEAHGERYGEFLKGMIG